MLAFLNTGQICFCLKRIYIHASVYSAFRTAFVKHVNALHTGDGFDPRTFCGPLQNSMQFNRVKSFFSDIDKENWDVAAGGTIDDTSGISKSYFVAPTVIDNPPDGSRIVVEEPFGPIVPILSWETEQEVISRANATRMGLGASVWSADLETANRIAKQLEAGTVWVNNHFDLSPKASFGGLKESGMGVELGLAGLKGFCDSQTLVVNKKGVV
jgi:acyl-CoA reductase-like NAD-dependent aldehyde dehydrogenase